MLADSWRHSVSQLGLDNSVVEAFLFAAAAKSERMQVNASSRSELAPIAKRALASLPHA
jgi:hypothetical protein